MKIIVPNSVLDKELPLQLNISFQKVFVHKTFWKHRKNAGEDYDLNVRNFEDDDVYIMACTFILGFVHGYSVGLKRPFYFDIPDKTTRTTKYYRTTFNAAFSETELGTMILML